MQISCGYYRLALFSQLKLVTILIPCQSSGSGASRVSVQELFEHSPTVVLCLKEAQKYVSELYKEILTVATHWPRIVFH